MEARGPAGLQPNLDVESSTLNVEYCLMPSSYIMVGGFLGAGKTTLIQRFAKYIDGKGHKVGLITNDQGVGLVGFYDWPIQPVSC